MSSNRAASYFLPDLNGDFHSEKDLITKPSIATSARIITPAHQRKCSNRNGKGLQCKRFARIGFKRCAECSHSSFESLKRNFLTRMIVHSKSRDNTKGYKWAPTDYVDRPWLNAMFKRTGPTCYWCGAQNLNCRTRTGADGFTLERLSNDLPHLKRNCVFACGGCNRMSWRKGFCAPPFHVRKFRYSLHPHLTQSTMVKHDRMCLELLSH